MTAVSAYHKLTDMSVSKPPVKQSLVSAAASKDRRVELLSAAADVFVQKGFHEAKVSDVVAAAGVAQGTFYLYFKNKTDVLQQLIGGCCQDIVLRITPDSAVETEIKTSEGLREQNLAFLIDVFKLLETEHQAAQLILGSMAGADPIVDKTLSDFRAALVRIIKECLEEGIAGGYVRRLDPEIIAEGIVGMIYHIAFERFVRKRRLGTTIEQLAEEIIDFEMNGIAARTKGK